jgi:glycosyltransferase involved in cell wall biosynthesis
MSADPTPDARRIFIVSDTLAGGLGALVRNQARWFAAHGWRVALAAPSDGRNAEGDVRLVSVPTVRSTRHVGQMVALARAMRVAWREHGSTGMIVHVHGMRSFLAWRLAGLPKPFVSVHGTHPSADDPAGYDALRRAWFALIPRLARGATTGEPRAQRGWTYRPFASPLLASLDVLRFPDARSTPTFAWLGLLDTRKQPELFVRAIAGAASAGSRVHGVMGGDGPRRDEIAALVKTLDAPIELVGQTDPVPVLAQAWALCLFAKSEGTPLAVTEAMWAGRSVIGSDVPGIRHLIGDTGVLADDVAAATAAIVALAADHDLAAARGAAAAERIRTLITPDTPWPELERLYTS